MFAKIIIIMKYRYLMTKKTGVLKDETTKLIVALFVNSTNNSSSTISKIVGVPECLVNEILSDILKQRDQTPLPFVDAEMFHEVSESSIRDVTPVENIVARYNTPCYSSADFRTRLETIKTI